REGVAVRELPVGAAAPAAADLHDRAASADHAGDVAVATGRIQRQRLAIEIDVAADGQRSAADGPHLGRGGGEIDGDRAAAGAADAARAEVHGGAAEDIAGAGDGDGVEGSAGGEVVDVREVRRTGRKEEIVA